MKKVLLAVGMALAATVLSGCTEAKYDEKDFNKYFSITEYSVAKAWNSQTGTPDLSEYMEAIYLKRKNAQSIPADDQFFCDVKPVLAAIDIRAEQRKVSTMTAVYQKMHGGELPCSGKAVEASAPVAVEEEKAEVVLVEAPGVTAAPATPATIETMRQLVETVKTCNRAKVQVINNTSDLRSLSQAQAEEMILQCELAKLEAELNQ